MFEIVDFLFGVFFNFWQCVTRTVHVTHDFSCPETAKITKNGLVTHHCARFFAEFACYAQDFFPTQAGVLQQRCATLILFFIVTYTLKLFF